ncbi:MAG: hypothetical protein K8I30_00375 [Anaerolineae bacterium]|nr:hypothetical protein [Anaerolineae bacterium]
MKIMRCPSCDGFAWVEDDDGQAVDCDWCGGVGYVYRDESGVDHPIPPADYGKTAAVLEKLELERMRELGYSGSAKKPWEQAIRKKDD